MVLDEVAEVAQRERGRLAAAARAEGVSAEDAVDCVQEALAAMLRLDQRGELPAARAEWPPLLATIVRNAARNRRRRHDRSRSHLEIVDETMADLDHDLADEALARAEEHVRLRACVRELCDVQRAVVTLRMLEEKPGEDVAAALGISSGHVAVLLYRAKKALFSCMTEDRAARPR